MATTMDRDFTPTGLRIEGGYENDRNAEGSQMFKDIIREAFGVTDVIIAHHLVYVSVDRRADGFEYQVVQEIPAADTLIFDHDIAKKIFGDSYINVLCRLACEPVATRDKVLANLYYGRQSKARAA